MGVPRLHVVVNRVFLLTVAFAYVNERIVESVVVPAAALPVESQHHAAAMPRDIGYLMTIISVVRIRHINSRLVGIIEPCAEREVQGQEERQVGFGIHAIDLDRTQIEHGPAELLPFGIRNDFVRHTVVIITDRCAERIKTVLRTERPIYYLYRVLARQFGA